MHAFSSVPEVALWFSHIFLDTFLLLPSLPPSSFSLLSSLAFLPSCLPSFFPSFCYPNLRALLLFSSWYLRLCNPHRPSEAPKGTYYLVGPLRKLSEWTMAAFPHPPPHWEVRLHGLQHILLTVCSAYVRNFCFLWESVPALQTHSSLSYRLWNQFPQGLSFLSHPAIG